MTRATGSGEPEPHPPGRPRSEASRDATLAAAYELLRDEGFRGVTTTGIARRAGVSTATVYRWWRSKADVLLDAVHSRADQYPGFGAGEDLREVLIEEIKGVIRFYASPAGQATLDLIAEARFDADLATGLRERFIAERRAAALAALKRGIASGQVRADLDPAPVIDALWGALYYRLLISGESLTPRYARRLVDDLWPAIAPQG